MLYEICECVARISGGTRIYRDSHGGIKRSTSPLMKEEVKDCFRDYISNENTSSYQSLHITFFDNCANCHMEVQIRTKDMVIRQRLEVPITRIMKNGRRKKEADATRSRKGNVSGSMKRMSVVSACSIWIFPDWMSICSLPWTTA